MRAHFPFLIGFASLGAMAACSSSDAASGSAISKVAGDGQAAVTGAPVATPPAVKVTENGVAAPGIVVTFAVASGGGIVSGGTATTDSAGVASVISWTLGASIGTNTLTATLDGAAGSPVTFTATGLVPGALSKLAGDNQMATVLSRVAIAPSVQLIDGYGNPVVGAEVTFSVSSGGGSLTGANVFTNSGGIATVGSWNLGASPGTNTLTASAAGSGINGNPAVFTATGTPSQ